MHALIIEDDFFVADLIEARLRDLGSTSFAVATSEQEAVTKATSQYLDFITSDVRLATGSGIDAVERICNIKPVPTLYIIGSAGVVHDRYPDAFTFRNRSGMPTSFSETGLHPASPDCSCGNADDPPC